MSQVKTMLLVLLLREKADATYIATYVNTSTWAITNTAWADDSAAYAEFSDPYRGFEVSSSLRVYYGCYDNSWQNYNSHNYIY